MIPGERAGAGKRALALVIDLAVLNIIQGVLVTLLQGERAILGFNLIVWIAYSVYFEGVRGATPGKILLGLRIVRADGSPADYQQVFVRCLVKLIPLLGLVAGSWLQFTGMSFAWRLGGALGGLLMAVAWGAALARHPSRLAFHDRLSGTCVIRVF